MKCPKCSYERKATEQAPAWQCPSCGVAYAKVNQAQPAPPPAPRVIEPDTRTEDETEQRLALAAQGQRMLIHAILMNVLLRAADQSHTIAAIVLLLLSVAVGIYALVGVVKICSGQARSQGQKILFMVLSFIPLVNLVAMVMLSLKTSGALRQAGWKVGLLGSRP